MSTWEERWYQELDRPRNRYIALPGDATLGQALALLRTPQVNGAAHWHLVVARADGSWAFARFDGLYGVVESQGARALDIPLDDLEALQPARDGQIVDLSEVGIGEAEQEARAAPGKLLLVLDGEELAGVVYTGTERGLVSASALNELAGRYADPGEFAALLIKPRRALAADVPPFPPTEPAEREDDQAARGRSAGETTGTRAPEGQTITRFPDVSLPERVALGRRCALRVAVTQQPVTPAVAELAMTLTLPSAAEAVAVDVLVTAPDFEIVGDPYRELVVPVEGDSDPLLFQLVPKVAGAKRVKVEFFQASRYVGGLTLETTVVESASAADERPGRVAGWLGLEREAVAADLTLLVTECPADGEHRVFRFTVHSPANGLFYHPIGEPLRFDGPPSGWMDNLYRELGYLGGEADPEDLAETLGSIGADLYERLFPAELKRLWGERVRGRVDTLMIISDEPWIPWELIKPSYETEGGGYEEEDFLCAGYLLTRWLAGPSPPSRIRVARSALIAPALVDLPHVQQEVRFLKTHLAGAQEVAPELAGVRALLREGGYQLFHFACHGSFDAGEHEQAVVYLQGNDVLRSREISGARRGFSRDRPFVFLNACQTGRGDFSLVGVGSWADRFIRANSSGFIGSSWEVNDGLAYRFSSRFYEALGEGVAVGAAVRQARLAIREEPDPSWLAYTLYADPLAVVSFG